MLELLNAALLQVANPFALAGFIGLGVYSRRLWQAVKYGVLWGAAVQIFVMSLGRTNILDVDTLAVQVGLRLAGAVIITVGVFYLYRALQGRGAGGGKGGSHGSSGGVGGANGAQKPRPSHLRRIK